MFNRYRAVYGDVTLSVVTGSSAYCSPRSDSTTIGNAETVEIAVLNKAGDLVLPSFAGVADYDHLFESGGSPVAPHVSIADMTALNAAIAMACGAYVKPIAACGNSRNEPVTQAITDLARAVAGGPGPLVGCAAE